VLGQHRSVFLHLLPAHASATAAPLFVQQLHVCSRLFLAALSCLQLLRPELPHLRGIKSDNKIFRGRRLQLTVPAGTVSLGATAPARPV
jgi:hypothetical protein